MEEVDDKANSVGRSKPEEVWWHIPLSCHCPFQRLPAWCLISEMGTKGFGITVPHLWRIQWPRHLSPSQAGSGGCGSQGVRGGVVPPLHGCSVCGKGFQETIDQMKPP